jgi:hypothetical protein
LGVLLRTDRCAFFALPQDEGNLRLRKLRSLHGPSSSNGPNHTKLNFQAKIGPKTGRSQWHEGAGAGRGGHRTIPDIADSLVNGQGIYSSEYHYWHGGLAMSRDAAPSACLQKADSVTLLSGKSKDGQ